LNTELVCLMGIGGSSKDIETAPNQQSKAWLRTQKRHKSSVTRFLDPPMLKPVLLGDS
jgi:hypothetical protein